MRLKLIVPLQDKKAVKYLAPPLGLGVLAALTPPEIDVSITDENIEEVDFEEKVDLVGISVITPAAYNAYRIADKYREKGVRVILGGFHVTALPEEAIQHADAVCLGEMESIWQEVLDDFKQGNLQRVYRCKGWPSPLKIPIARRDLFKKRGYLIRNTILTTRGCPFTCDFCSVRSFFGGTYRFRPIEDILEEIATFKRGGPPVVFVDDSVIADPKRSKELFKALISYKIKWISQGTITMANDDELLDLMSRSGCVGIFIGFESLSQANLARSGKGINKVEQFEEAIKKIHSYGMIIMGAFMFGMDDDDESIFEKTLTFARRNKLELVAFGIITPFPGTPLYSKMKQAGRLLHENWKHYDAAHVVFKPKLMSPRVIQEGQAWAWKEFYSYPSIYQRLGIFRKNFLLSWLLNIVHRNVTPGLERIAKYEVPDLEN